MSLRTSFNILQVSILNKKLEAVFFQAEISLTFSLNLLTCMIHTHYLTHLDTQHEQGHTHKHPHTRRHTISTQATFQVLVSCPSD